MIHTIYRNRTNRTDKTNRRYYLPDDGLETHFSSPGFRCALSAASRRLAGKCVPSQRLGTRAKLFLSAKGAYAS